MLAAFMLLFSTLVLSQTAKDSIIQAKIDNLYKLALQYKNGKGVDMNYTTAYNYFLQAAELGDAQSIYAVAYMHYKGLGCQQNYDTAAKLFAQGASLGRDNSLYFYGLCWRNGYGLSKNVDSAKYYLNKAAQLDYKQANMELQMIDAEDAGDSAAQVLLHQINNAAVPSNKVLNQYNKIQPHLQSSNLLAGQYTGWLIQYDWSGKHIAATKRLKLNISANRNNISGLWIEENADTAKIKGDISGDSIVFTRTQYGRKDHYSPDKTIQYNFQNAKLNLIQMGDSIFLAGTIEMFSPVRGEPSKPLFLALARPGLKDLDSMFLKNLALTAYPNPFEKIVTIQFNIIKAANVEIRLYDINGVLQYKNYAGTLQEGTYAFPLSDLKIIPGVYIVTLTTGKGMASLKIIKE